MYGAERGHRYSTALVRDIHQESRTSVSASSGAGSIHRVEMKGFMEMKEVKIKMIARWDFCERSGCAIS